MKVIILTACCLVAATQVHAADDISVLREKVFVGDLRTDTTAGMEALYSRVQAAAKRVCSPLAFRSRMQLEFNQCTREAFDRATMQIPALANYDHKKHKIRNG
jgi:UrcA family protein